MQFPSHLKRFVIALMLAGAACVTVPPRPNPGPGPGPKPPDPTPIPPAASTVTLDYVACDTGTFTQNYCPGLKGATFALEVSPNTWKTYKGNDGGYVVISDFPAGIPDSRITVAAPGYITLGPVHLDVTAAVANTATVCEPTTGDHCHNHADLFPVAPPFPPPPTRTEMLNMHITGQGMTVVTQQYGTLPWWEAALTYLNPADRATIYAAKHASTAWPGGDTHGIIAVPSGRALYDEPGQPYSADRFPPMDWTNGHTKMDPQFDALVIEMIQNGFHPMIFLDETYATSIATLPIVIDALQHSPQGDLTRYVLIGPGWDGVFYGWEPSKTVIPGWASLARSTCPNCYLFIEHNVGHIPLGEGPSDWCPTCLMKDFDLLLSEFWDGIFDDTVWQIGGRTIGMVSKGGTYIRPPDQPAGDDTNPPFYLAPGTYRGPFLACAFEFGMYGWVRSNSTAEQQASWRQYFKNIGYTCGG